MSDPVLRLARPEESDVVATIARHTREHFLSYLPQLHSLEGDKKFYRDHVFRECEVWVAVDSGQIVGFCAFKKGWLEHLYLLPSHVGRSIGAALLDKAKTGQPSLKLWVFQPNQMAKRFYKKHGFQKVHETDGSCNEEKVPDALYEWFHGQD